LGAVDDVEAGAAAELVAGGLLELLREQPAANMPTTSATESATDLFTTPPGVRN
jgi:hypothetical protein